MRNTIDAINSAREKMDVRIIKTDEQYRHFQAEVAQLAGEDPEPNSEAGARLEVLAKLVEDYEKAVFPFDKPDPVAAILFRMEQQGLRQKDIAELLGGKNRASEILSRKRALTLPMIRALHKRLEIPAQLLIDEIDSSEGDDLEGSPNESEAPIELIISRGWSSTESGARHLWKRLINEHPGSPAYLKHTVTFGRNRNTNLTNVWLWLAQVRNVADARELVHQRFDKSSLTEELIRYVSRLSWMSNGPRLAIRFLEDRGIAVVVEPHLPATHLDGAAMLSCRGTPVIGLTLREDRLDNFWFTLVHELIHAWKHLNSRGYRAIVDERIELGQEKEGIEKEANQLAGEILIPRAHWKRSQAYLRPTADSINKLAAQLQISPAIVAGRIRHERKNFTLFSKLVGYHQARIQFPDVRWT
jgi:HTH-type transcriptional regulator / antitoxin HigA